MTEEFYFTIDELHRAFALIVGDVAAGELTTAWRSGSGAIFDGKVVALPASFGFPALNPRRDPGDIDQTPVDDAVYDSLHGRRLLRLTPGTLTLIAAANPEARARFDRIGLEYGYKTIDDPASWNQLVAFLRDT